MGKYQFTHSWRLQTTAQAVWERISDFEAIEDWEGVTFQKVYHHGHPHGVGDHYRMHIRTRFGYRLTFQFSIVEKQECALIRLEATGDLHGYGIFRLEQCGDCTVLHYYWEVQTTKPWMKWCEPWLRPFFIWNHNQVIYRGIQGLTQHLELQLP